ncbi:MAG: hypothetical protein NC095_11395 [Muribaculum sp.]|nr:hypothetical protein [Muribaculum sp.]
MKIRIFILSFMMVLVAGTAFAQDASHGYNIYGQIAGTGNGIGIGFDSRFKAGGVLGYSAGISFVDLSYSDNFDGGYDYRSVNCQGVSIPLEVNAIMGKRASKFEVGLGLVTYLVDRQQNYSKYQYVFDEQGEYMGTMNLSNRKSGFRTNIAGTLSIGYRLQRKNGFFMKLGLSMLIGRLGCSPFDGVIALPNICLGYTIPHF